VAFLKGGVSFTQIRAATAQRSLKPVVELVVNIEAVLYNFLGGKK
jgi:hypothetical protein